MAGSLTTPKAVQRWINNHKYKDYFLASEIITDLHGYKEGLIRQQLHWLVANGHLASRVTGRELVYRRIPRNQATAVKREKFETTTDLLKAMARFHGKQMLLVPPKVEQARSLWDDEDLLTNY